MTIQAIPSRKSKGGKRRLSRPEKYLRSAVPKPDVYVDGRRHRSGKTIFELLAERAAASHKTNGHTKGAKALQD